MINFGSDSFEGTDLDRILRANAIGHLFVSGQCIEHVVATTIKRAANMGYNATLIKDATSGFTDSNYRAMLDILPLYARLITSAEFMLDAPYGGTARSDRAPEARNSFSDRGLFSFGRDRGDGRPRPRLPPLASAPMKAVCWVERNVGLAVSVRSTGGRGPTAAPVIARPVIFLTGRPRVAPIAHNLMATWLSLLRAGARGLGP